MFAFHSFRRIEYALYVEVRVSEVSSSFPAQQVIARSQVLSYENTATTYVYVRDNEKYHLVSQAKL